MQSDFELLCKRAHDAIIVPPMPRTLLETRRRNPQVLAVALFVGISMAAAAAATILGTGHLTFTPKGGILLSGDVTTTDRVSPANVAAIAERADFHVTLPAGLPVGARLKRVVTGGTSVIALQYDLPGAWRRNDHMLYIFLANPTAMRRVPPKSHPKSQLAIPKGSIYRVELWRIPGEDVTVVAQRSGITNVELAAMKSAMERAASSPR